MPGHKNHEVKKYFENAYTQNIYLQPKSTYSCMLDPEIPKITENTNQKFKYHDFYLLLSYLWYHFPSRRKCLIRLNQNTY